MILEKVLSIKENQLPENIGAKATQIRMLQDSQFRTPETWVIPWTYHLAYLAGDQSPLQMIRDQLKTIFSPGKLYAVRSSADVEDSRNQSYAGQFLTVLNVSSVDAICDAIVEVWSSANSLQLKGYLTHHGTSEDIPRMAVIIQEMVTPIVSGVAFSCNPVTGSEELIIEAVEGDGLKLMGTGITPYHWGYLGKNCTSSPVSRPQWQKLADTVARKTRKLARVLGHPVDAEWVYDGSKLYWVQAREIRQVKPVDVYSNQMAREMIPGMIKPLIWSINIPLVNTVWVNLLTEMVGDHGIQPMDLARAFHYHAYFNLTALGRVFRKMGLPADSLEIMMGIRNTDSKQKIFSPTPQMISLIPRFIRFAMRQWHIPKRVDQQLPAYRQEIYKFHPEEIQNQAVDELLQTYRMLYRQVQDLAYFNIVIPLNLALYTRLLLRALKKNGISAEAHDLIRNENSIVSFNPTPFFQEMHQQYMALSQEEQLLFLRLPYLELENHSNFGNLLEDMNEFLVQFGHFSNSGNDFSAIPWREQPDEIKNMIIQYPDMDKSHTAGPSLDLSHIKRLRRKRINRLHQRVISFTRYRDQISSLYTYGYGLFRPLFLTLAAQLVKLGELSHADDIFYIPVEDVLLAVQQQQEQTEPLSQIANNHQQAMEYASHIDLPPVIFGETIPDTLPELSEQLVGVATSPGFYTGPACLIHGIDEFAKLKEGDVLVIPFSDVGWTPLFARAGAVVSQSGGMLSHSSIIAREFGIPAVVSIEGAMKLKDGQMIAVDGYRGQVSIIHTDMDEYHENR